MRYGVSRIEVLFWFKPRLDCRNNCSVFPRRDIQSVLKLPP